MNNNLLPDVILSIKKLLNNEISYVVFGPFFDIFSFLIDFYNPVILGGIQFNFA